jgi:hypothetical protein
VVAAELELGRVGLLAAWLPLGQEPIQHDGGCWFVVLLCLSWMRIGAIDDVAV